MLCEQCKSAYPGICQKTSLVEIMKFINIITESNESIQESVNAVFAKNFDLACAVTNHPIMDSKSEVESLFEDMNRVSNKLEANDCWNFISAQHDFPDRVTAVSRDFDKNLENILQLSIEDFQ